MSVENDALNMDFWIACQNGEYNKCVSLHEKGAKINPTTLVGNSSLWTPLHFGIYSEIKDIVYYLIDNGADMNAKAEHGVTPLHTAVIGNDIDMVQILVERGADINARYDGRDGMTPLELAKKDKKDFKIISYLEEMTRRMDTKKY